MRCSWVTCPTCMYMSKEAAPRWVRSPDNNKTCWSSSTLNHLCMSFCLSEQLAGVHSTTLNTLPNGTFELAEMESKIRHGYPKTRYTRSRLICLENTHNIVGGRVLPLTFLKEVRVRVYGWFGFACLSCVVNISYYTSTAKTLPWQAIDSVCIVAKKSHCTLYMES